jgi:hypothetical protein
MGDASDWPQDTLRRGIFGGPGGTPFIESYPGPRRIESICIWSGAVLDSFRLTWDGIVEPGLRHGGIGGDPFLFTVPAGKYLKAVRGSTGPYGLEWVVTSLVLETSDGTFSPHFGLGGGEPFRVEASDGHHILGFWGAASRVVDSLGIILAKLPVK